MDFTLKRRLTDFPPSRQLRFLIGRALLRIHPELAGRVDAAPHSGNWSAREKLLRNGLYYRALRTRDYDTLGRYLADYWSVDANVGFHELFADRYENHFLLRDARLVPEIESLAAAASGYRTLCEIGCGNGMVLDYFRRHVSVFQRHLGLDLSRSRIEKNRGQYGGTMDFEACDAAAWIEDGGDPGTVFLTNGGVFECFAPAALERLIVRARDRLAPVAFALVENLATDHDIEADRHSHVYAHEFSFSHNYPYLFRAAGYRIRHFRQYRAAGERWINLLAEYPRRSGDGIQ